MKPPACVIGLSGLSGCGKDSAARYLEERHLFRRVAVADPLKRWVQTVFGLSDDQLWGAGRDIMDPRLRLTPREVYQRFGDACRKIDPDVLIRAFQSAMRQVLADGCSVVCPDVRTVEEMEAIRAEGGLVCRIVRSGAGAPGMAGEHGTETRLAALPDAAFESVIRNEGTLSDLALQLDEVAAMSLRLASRTRPSGWVAGRRYGSVTP